MNMRGKVMQTVIALGSKSDHSARIIVYDEGEFVLRRSGRNPFADPEIDKPFGNQIECQGSVHGQEFIMDDWTDIEGEKTT